MFYYIALVLGLICCSLLLVKTPHPTSHKVSRLKQHKKSSSNISPIIQNNDSKKEQNFHHGVNFVTLQNKTELGIHYHPKANTLNANHKYAIIVANRLESKSTIQYTFQLPLACLAWTEMGFGCLIVIPYFVDLQLPSKNGLTNPVQRANDEISGTIASWNKNDKGNNVVMYLNSKTSDDLIQLSQVSRLFMAHLLKYSMTKTEFYMIQGLYLITTDVDLLPLSPKYFQEHSFDWNLVNTVFFNEEQDVLYIALSCIGSTVKIWYNQTPETKYNVEFYNSSGIQKMIKIETETRLKEHPELDKQTAGKPGHKDIDWYMDQMLASDWIKEYANKYGWDKIKPKRYGVNDNRVDRIHHRNGVWDQVVDLQSHSPYKDLHTCKEPYKDDCFFDLIHILSYIVPQTKLDWLIEYRSRFLDIVLSSSSVGEPGQIDRIKQDNNLRRKLQGELRDKKLPYVDSRKAWTHFYPRMYRQNHPFKKDSVYKPHNINWDTERLFKVDDGKVKGRWNKFDDVGYMVIQKMSLTSIKIID